MFPILLQAQVAELTKILNTKGLEKEEKMIKIDALVSIYNETQNDSLPYLYVDYAAWLYENEEIGKAIKQQKKALNGVHIDSDFLQKNNYTLGDYLSDNKPLEAIRYLKKSLKLNNKNKLAIDSYYLLGYVYYFMNDHKKSTSYYETSINLANLNKVVNERLLKAYNNLASIQRYDINDENYKKGIKNCKLADSISIIINPNWMIKYSLKYNLALFYNRPDIKYFNLKKGLKYLNEALKIAKKNKDTIKIGHVYRNISRLYNRVNYKKSLFYNNKALELYKKTDSTNLIFINVWFSITYAKNKQYKKSIEYNHKSLSYLTSHELKDYKKIDKKILINSKDQGQLLYNFYLLAETYLKYYEETKDVTLLEKSISCFKLTDNVLDMLMLNTNEFNSRMYWREVNENIYGKVLKACYLNNDIEEAFYYMEKNKASLLMEDIANQNYRKSQSIPLELLEKENNLKEQCVFLENSLENVLDKKEKNSLNKVLLDTKRDLLSFQDSIYKKDKLIKANTKLLSIAEVQKKLKEQEIFVSYYVSEEKEHVVYSNKENGYVIFITKNNNYFFEINNLSNLKSKVVKLINLSKKSFRAKEDFTNYNQLSFEVYNKLFPTTAIKALLKDKKVIIAPDSYLSFLPFETLITKDNKNKIEKPNYLIRDCAISYVYSYSFLENIVPTKTENTSFLGVAPIQFKETSLTSLKNSENEILTLNNYYKGETFTNHNATKNHFLEQLPKHQLIHLATHANAQDSVQPWIAFNDKKINLSELYLTKNKASLVVLSGCNTTLGKEETGEGVMSLARGFFYGGSQSVVSSLWSVDDKSTPYIMNEFYKNLYQGKTKSEALRNAKLSYLDYHSLSELSPHYWASFILLGKDGILPHSAFNWYPYLVGFTVILFFVFLIIFYKRRKQL